MPMVFVRKFLTTTVDKKASPQLIFWFSLSLTFAAIFGWLGVWTAFSSEYVIQDDARQHVFWMQRFLDPQLFPNDLIADYFQSVAQPGYITLYRLMAALGINPLLFSKVLPFILVLITTAYCFGVCLQLLPLPVAGFISTLLLNQNLWLKDDVVSGTARAFMYPLFLAFLYYLLRRSLFPFLVAIALLGLFYPSGLLIAAGILILRLWRWDGRVRFDRQPSTYLFTATGLAVSLLVMLPLALESSNFGAVITSAAARSMPEFSEIGRTRFFVNNPIEFWFYADRSGIFPVEWSRLPYKYFPLMLCLGLSLPILQRFPSRFPLVRHISSSAILLPQIATVSLSLFFLAHAFLFKLYLPSRYTQYSIRILMALSAAIVLSILIDATFQRSGKQILAITLTVVVVALFSYPLLLRLKHFPIPSTASYIVGYPPELYKFLSQQPKDTLIASLASEANNIPTFAQRSVLTTKEYSIPYHTKYYAQIRQRTIELIVAQYSPDLTQVKSFIQKYGIDLWLLDRNYLFKPYKETNNQLNSTDRWIRQFSAANEIDSSSQQQIPALSSFVNRCSIFDTQSLVVLSTKCIKESAP